jgi:hypothetical protein
MIYPLRARASVAIVQTAFAQLIDISSWAVLVQSLFQSENTHSFRKAGDTPFSSVEGKIGKSKGMEDFLDRNCA